jgi:hypothetical protein
VNCEQFHDINTVVYVLEEQTCGSIALFLFSELVILGVFFRCLPFCRIGSRHIGIGTTQIPWQEYVHICTYMHMYHVCVSVILFLNIDQNLVPNKL